MIVDAVEAILTLSRPIPAHLIESDEELKKHVLNALQGGASGIAFLYQRYRDSLVRAARAHAKKPSDADDAVQDIFLKVQQGKFKSFGQKVASGQSEAGRIFAVLLRAVINATRNMRRDTKKEKDVETLPDAPEKLSEPDTSASDSTKSAVREAVKRAIATGGWTDKEREAIEKLTGGGEQITFGDSEDSKVAAAVWPDKKPGAQRAQMLRVKKRFLKAMYDDPEFAAQLKVQNEARGRYFDSMIAAKCESIDADAGRDALDYKVVRTCFVLGLTEDVFKLSRDKAYDMVLSWIRGVDTL